MPPTASYARSQAGDHKGQALSVVVVGATSKPLTPTSRMVSKTLNLDKEQGVKTVRLSASPVDPLERSATWDFRSKKK